MIIKKQLWVSNFITIVITIFLLIMVSILIGKNYQNISRFGLSPQNFGREEESRGHFDLLERELRIADRMIERVLRESPEALEDIKYIQQLDAFMNASNSGIIILTFAATALKKSARSYVVRPNGFLILQKVVADSGFFRGSQYFFYIP